MWHPPRRRGILLLLLLAQFCCLSSWPLGLEAQQREERAKPLATSKVQRPPPCTQSTDGKRKVPSDFVHVDIATNDKGNPVRIRRMCVDEDQARLSNGALCQFGIVTWDYQGKKSMQCKDRDEQGPFSGRYPTPSDEIRARVEGTFGAEAPPARIAPAGNPELPSTEAHRLQNELINARGGAGLEAYAQSETRAEVINRAFEEFDVDAEGDTNIYPGSNVTTIREGSGQQRIVSSWTGELVGVTQGGNSYLIDSEGVMHRVDPDSRRAPLDLIDSLTRYDAYEQMALGNLRQLQDNGDGTYTASTPVGRVRIEARMATELLQHGADIYGMENTAQKIADLTNNRVNLMPSYGTNENGEQPLPMGTQALIARTAEDTFARLPAGTFENTAGITIQPRHIQGIATGLYMPGSRVITIGSNHEGFWDSDEDRIRLQRVGHEVGHALLHDPSLLNPQLSNRDIGLFHSSFQNAWRSSLYGDSSVPGLYSQDAANMRGRSFLPPGTWNEYSNVNPFEHSAEIFGNVVTGEASGRAQADPTYAKGVAYIYNVLRQDYGADTSNTAKPVTDAARIYSTPVGQLFNEWCSWVGVCARQ